MRKRCGRCGRSRLLRFFNKRRGTQLQPYCRPCQKAANEAHYAGHRQAQLEKAVRRRALLREQISAAKAKPRAACGRSYPYYVMDFDHREGKSFFISQAWRARSWGKVVAEMEKCDVVCANCHRERTHNRNVRAGI